MIRVGIDASNIRAGGGVTHLSQLLAHALPERAGIGQIVVWASKVTLGKLPDRPWLEKRAPEALDGPLPKRILWQQFSLPRELVLESCQVLFSPGGTLPRRVPQGVRTVTLSQNMLPFQPEEAARFGVGSWMWLKMNLLRRSQGRSFRRADGMIFLTRFARDTICPTLGIDPSQTIIVPHGIEPRFFIERKEQKARATSDPFCLLYVSIIDVYKHQDNVAEAVALLRAEGLPVSIDFVGPSYAPAMAHFKEVLARFDPEGSFLRYRGPLPFTELHSAYEAADAFVFASSCENLPNILLEAMAAGLPVASSKMGPMPEVLKDFGVYFDPLDVDSIAEALRHFVSDSALCQTLARKAQEEARAYTWGGCADATLGFVADVGGADAPVP